MSRQQAIRAASQPLTEAYARLLGLDGSSVEDAAHAAWTPTGPDLPTLIARIRHRRADQLAA